MTTRTRAARVVIALAFLTIAVLGISGCAAVPPSNGTSVSTTTTRDKQLEAAVAASPSGSHVAAWYRQVGSRISAVEHAVADAQRAVRRPGHRGLHAACRVLLHRVERVQDARPVPDRIARRAVAREMSALAAAAGHCLKNELLAAGRDTDLALHWSRVAGARILHILKQGH